MGGLKTGLEFGLLLPGLSHHSAMIMTYSLIAMAAVFLFFFIVALTARRRVPHKVQLVVEMFFEYGLNMMDEVMGKGGSKYYPLIAALFFFILIANLMGIVPGFVAPTTNININLPLALLVFSATFYVGIRELGFWKFMRHRMGPVLVIGPIFFVLETIGEMFRPVSLTLRLMGNIMGEDIFIMVLYKMTELGIFVKIGLALVIPAIYVLAIITSFLQAFIFAVLPIIYFGGAIGWGEEDH
ncbi:MAG: F0F1 ATP synthase subunit A [bacterium]|nr:F0F1 ATP synthase subunit A [bacterium]